MSSFAVFLVSSFLFLTSVSAKRSDILVNLEKESWISAENFSTLLQVSLNVSTLCNVQISGHSAGTENILNEFVQIYRYKYLVNNQTYDCNGYFMISESVDNLVTDIKNAPTRISTTEFLIILDDNAGNSTNLFNVSMYGNSNVNIAAHDGLWTLSENFLRPRVFKKRSRHSEMIHKRGIVDLEGRKLQGATRFLPPICFLRTTVNQTVNGIEAEIFVPKNESELDGVEFKLFLLIAERLNFTWTLRQPNYHQRYGGPNGTRWSGGTVGLLFENKVDIVFSGTWLQATTYRFVNLTIPWTVMGFAFLVPRPKSHLSKWALTEPLSPGVWLAVLVVLIIQSVHIYTSSWISPRIANRFRSLSVTVTELIGRFLGTMAPKNMQGLKIQFYLWHFFGILLITAYTSNLSAILTNPKYDARIDNQDDFVKANLTWGRIGGIEDFAILLNNTRTTVNEITKLYKRERDENERHERIMEGNYAIFGVMMGPSFFPEEPVRNEDFENLRLMKEPLQKFYTTMAVQPWLLQPVNEVLSRLNECGLVDYHLHDVLRRRTARELREVLIEHDGIIETPSVLQLTPLGAGFFILIVGLIMSSLTFFIELYIADEKK